MTAYDPIIGWAYKGQNFTTLGLRAFLRREGHHLPDPWTAIEQIPTLTEVPAPIYAADVPDGMPVLITMQDVAAHEVAKVERQVTITFDLVSRTERGFEVMLGDIVEALSSNPYLTNLKHETRGVR